MRIRVEVTSGARRGLRRTFEGPRVSVGRHPDCDLQLDPEVDRAASARHAVFLLAGGRWIVRDVGSRNGTFVDDDAVEGERRLRDGDVVQFGRQGPRARIEILTSETHEFEEVEAGAGSGSDGREEAGRDGGGASGGSRRDAGSSGGGSGSGAGRDPGDTARTRNPGGSGGSGGGSGGGRKSGGGSGGSGSGGSGGSGGGSDPGASTTARLRQQVERRGKGLVILAVVLAALLGAGAAWFLLGGSGDSGGSGDGPVSMAGDAAGGGASPAASSERTDSVLLATRRTLDSLRGRVSGLQEALEDSRTRVARIQQQLRETRDGASDGGGDGAAERRALQRRLDSALTELQRQSALATTDFSGVESGQWRALAQVYVETAGGEVSTATAFAVRPEGLLVTSRHVVLAEDGNPAARIGVQFARSDQVWPAELVATHDEADLALIRARNVQGDVPVVSTLGDGDGTVAEGSPVALLGYSGGRRIPSSGEASGRLPRPALSVGLLLERGEDGLRLRGFGSEGGSGSPIFDAEGRLVGVLRGGVDEGSVDGRRILVAVPARVVRSLVDTVLERLGS